MGQNTFFRMDYANKTYTPISTAMRRMDKAQPFIPNGMLGQPGNKTFYHDGKEYVAFPAAGYSVALATTSFEHDGDRLNLVAVVGQLTPHPNQDGTAVLTSDGALRYHFYEGQQPDFFRDHGGDYFSWSDLNHDGQQTRPTRPAASAHPPIFGATAPIRTARYT
jgi:hypothetical protein